MSSFQNKTDGNEEADSDPNSFVLDPAKIGRECFLYYKCRVDDTESFKELLQLSSQGNETAKGFIAVLMRRTDLSQILSTFSIGDPMESATIMIEDILPWLEAEEQQANPNAQYIIGVCHQYGIHWEQDGPKGLKYLTKAAGMEHASAQCRLGFAYNSGTDVEQDRDMAFEYVNAALSASWSYCAHLSNHLPSRCSLYMEAAMQGYAIAQSNVAVEYSTGTGAVAQNLAIAATYYKLAADQGDKESQYCLGYAYATGKGVVESMEDAIKYYRMSADKGFVYAQYSLGFCFFQGKGVPVDTAMAIQYYRLAAEQGHAVSQQFLTQFYAGINDETGVKEGLGAVQQDSSRDDELDPSEMFTQAEAYYEGRGCVENKPRAVELYKQAAEAGHAEAQLKMGTIYARGLAGLEAQPEIGVQFYALAADQGNKAALYELGNCFSRGIGVEVDKAEAVKYHRLAAEGHDAEGSSCTVS